MFSTPTHQKFAVPFSTYPLMRMIGLPAGAFTPDPRVTPEAERLMESGEAVAFLEECDAHKWAHRIRRARGREDSGTAAESGDPWSPEMAAGKVREWIRQIEKATR